MLKPGFNEDAISREVGIRGAGKHGPFVSIDAFDADMTWFEEPLVQGIPLPRTPPWWDKRKLEQQALGHLAVWLDEHAANADCARHVGELGLQVHRSLGEMRRRFPDDLLLSADWEDSALPALARRAHSGQLSLSLTHGDFQPGNIYALSTRNETIITDWEFAARRLASYDFLTYGLRARYPQGLAARLAGFVASGEAGPATPFIRGAGSAAARGRLTATFLLEELARALTDAASGPYTNVPPGVTGLCSEVAQLGPRAERLLDP